MASSKVMASPNSRKSDLSRRSFAAAASSSVKTQFKNTTAGSNFISMNDDDILRDAYDSVPASESTLLDAQISLIDAPATVGDGSSVIGSPIVQKTVEDFWREIVSGDRRECKEEAPNELMTLEDFLAKAGAVEDDDVKIPAPLTERLSGGDVFTFDPMPPTPFQALENVEGSIIGFGNGVEVVESGVGGGGRGKRGRPVLEQLDKAVQKRQRRMIKNRESAARSRERRQAYQVELETLAVKLEEENEQLLKEKADKSKERYKQLMEKVIPVVEKRRPPRLLRRVQSLQW